MDAIASPGVRAFYRAFLEHGTDAARYRIALEVDQPRLRNLYAECFVRYGVVALCMPATRIVAPPMGRSTVQLDGVDVPVLFALLRNGHPGAAAGLPGLVLPAGLSRSGLPAGLELDGPIESDARLLAIASAVERVLPATPAPQTADRDG